MAWVNDYEADILDMEIVLTPDEEAYLAEEIEIPDDFSLENTADLNELKRLMNDRL